MCIFRRPSPAALPPTIAPIQPRLANETARKGSNLKKEDKELIDEDSVADVAYGSDKRTDTKLAKRTGTDALKIDVNTGATGTGSGGLNV